MNETMLGEKRKVVVFNLEREGELELFALAQRINFSQFVKKWLALENERLRQSEAKRW